MHFEQFGDVRIFRPSQVVENAIRHETRLHLFAKFRPGEHRGPEANALIQHQFLFYEKLLQRFVRKIASRDAATFLLFQFDQANRLLHGGGILDLRERDQWAWVEPRFKRAIKYLVELMCIQRPGAAPSVGRDESVGAMEAALVCAECVVDLAQQSELVHSIFPDDSVVTVFDSGSLDYDIRVSGQHAAHNEVFTKRVIRDRQSRRDIVGFPQFDNHTASHQPYMDPAFTSSFGMSYGEFLAAVTAVIDGFVPPLTGLPIPFIKRELVLDELAKSGRERSAIERAIGGFSISAENLTAERRVVWKPKQESRAYRRGFYVFPHETGPHITFSPAMASENLIQLVTWLPYRHIPKEWGSPATSFALNRLSQAAGAWFESVVRKNLQKIGISGQRVKRSLVRGVRSLRIPDSVGEIDFLGYRSEEKLLVLVEAKMVMTGLEARYWRDDLDEFVFRNGSYAERFRRKIAWVCENRSTIAEVLNLGEVTGVGVTMLTLYPCIVRAFISDFPCVSVTEFMLDYQLRGCWPYTKR